MYNDKIVSQKRTANRTQYANCFSSVERRWRDIEGKLLVFMQNKKHSDGRKLVDKYRALIKKSGGARDCPFFINF